MGYPGPGGSGGGAADRDRGRLLRPQLESTQFKIVPMRMLTVLVDQNRASRTSWSSLENAPMTIQVLRHSRCSSPLSARHQARVKGEAQMSFMGSAAG